MEGGATLLQLFIDQNTWDEAYVFTAQQQLLNGVKAPAFPYVPVSTKKIGDNFFHLYQSF